MTNKMARLGLAAALAGALALPAFAGPQDWKVDSSRSEARIATEARINESRQTVTLGAARVSGTLRLDENQVTNSTFEFSVYPDGSGPDAGSASYTAMHFRSQKATATPEGKLRVTGVLTVTRVEREAQLDPSEGYAGPQYTGRVAAEVTREASFVFALPVEGLVDAQGHASSEASAEAKISAEDFPELMYTVLGTSWPAIAKEKECTSNGTNSEDYAGYACSGSAAGLPSITRTATSIGEDYPGGASSVVQAGNAVTLALHLQLTEQSTPLSAHRGQ